MKTILYPAVFQKNDDGYMVTFPDLPGCITDGNNIYEAYEHAQEALGLYLDNESLPAATKDIDRIKVSGNERIMLVAADTANNIIYFNHDDFLTGINEILENKKITKYRLSKDLGINESYVNQIFKGKRKPSPAVAKKIGDYLGFDWKSFF